MVLSRCRHVENSTVAESPCRKTKTPMTKAAITSFCLFFVLHATAPAQNTGPGEDAATEAIRREAYKKELGDKLKEAQAAQKRGENFAAAKLYEDCAALAKKTGSGVEAEQKQVDGGIIAVRLILADQAYRNGDFSSADLHLKRVLDLDPRNPVALELKKTNDQATLAQEGRMPDKDTIDKLGRHPQTAAISGRPAGARSARATRPVRAVPSSLRSGAARHPAGSSTGRRRGGRPARIR